jgi:hypothetical protein
MHLSTHTHTHKIGNADGIRTCFENESLPSTSRKYRIRLELCSLCVFVGYNNISHNDRQADTRIYFNNNNILVACFVIMNCDLDGFFPFSVLFPTEGGFPVAVTGATGTTAAATAAAATTAAAK